MNATGIVLRMIGAAILLIAVQFAPVAAMAHTGHGPDAHHQGHSLHVHGIVSGIAHAVASEQASAVHDAAPTQQTEATARSTPGAQPADSGACVMGCCGCTGCCAAALASIAPSLPPKACSPRIGFARVLAVAGLDPGSLRKPPRSLA